MSATKLVQQGWTDLVSVIPPEGKLLPSSKIKPESRGKVPGRFKAGGWVGYDWKNTQLEAFDIGQIDRHNANIGLKSKHFPAVDIDCTDESIAKIIGNVAQEVLGNAPCRIGKPPKRLLVYKTDQPFSRMRLWITANKVTHLVEILADGQQFVIGGIHPATKKPYRWDKNLTELKPENLTAITKDQIDTFFDRLVTELEMFDCECEREGSGILKDAPVVEDQYSLRAPNMQALREAVSLIPNDSPSYDDYATFGIAIKAAGTEDLTTALDIFQEWASRWDGGFNDPRSVALDWQRMRAPFRIGWDWIAQQARHYGYLDAAVEFEADENANEEDDKANGTTPVEYSDAALADRLIAAHGADIKHCDTLGGWMVWDGNRWAKDETLQVHDWCGKILRSASHEAIMRSDFNSNKADRIAGHLASNGMRNSVCNYAKADRRVAAAADEFDADPWILNTPDGVVDLRTGDMRERIPGEALIRCTAVGPMHARQPFRFIEFLDEVTGGDKQFMEYLKRLCGYCLTGVISEQQLSFLHGNGGNGKSLFVVSVLAGVLGDYAKKSQMETFVASNNDRHPTELAALRGARMVYASETQGGRRWNEARIKELTGGEPVTARFMHKDEFTYTPQFKLLFLGNHRPELKQIDDGIKRRLHLIPFTVTPKRIDRELDVKLKDEWPSILAWMIEGCLEWQVEGLNAPDAVLSATEDYLEDEDAIGKWLKECCTVDGSLHATSASLYENWKSWCFEAGEQPGSQKRLSSALKSRGFDKWREPGTGKQGFRGIDVGNLDFEIGKIA